MAIFASTTLGSSDPSRAMNIKALEARAQALSAAQAKQETPASMPSPWQGAGYLANTVADAVATKRADQQAAEQKQQLANLMGQVGPEGPNPQQLAGITARDQDLGKMYAQQAFTARQDAASRQAQKELVTQKAQQDEAAAVSQEARVQARPPNDDLINLKRGLQQGILTQEEYDARVKKLNAGSPAEQKLLDEKQSENIDLQATANSLAEAARLLDSGKVYSGGGADLKGGIGKYVDVPGYTDTESTKTSQRYNQIMSAEVLPILSKLKGATSDKDMLWAINTLNDTTSDLETKKRALATLRVKMGAHLQQSEQTVKNMGGSAVKVEPPPAAGVTAPAAAPGGGDLLGEARKAIAAGAPRDKVMQRLKEKGVDATGL